MEDPEGMVSLGTVEPREYLRLHVRVGNGALDMTAHGVHGVKQRLVLQLDGYCTQPLLLHGGPKRARIIQAMPGCRSAQHTQKAVLNARIGDPAAPGACCG